MTEKLYYEDAYVREFDAVVLECREGKGKWEIVPDRSAFYPEGGGQSGDRGLLTEEGSGRRIEVLDTREKGGDIFLVCGEPVEKGTRIHGEIDWEYRFDRMQNHSGEHIVSGLIHSRFGYNNVGFHMSADRMTIDLDGEIPEAEIARIQQEANEIVWKNVPVGTDFYTEEEAAGIDYRSKKGLHGEIRIVRIPGADACACCGTHVARTGEIGLILLLSHARFKGGVRMEMMCGRWAYRYLAELFDQSHQISVLLSSRMPEIASAVRRLQEEHLQLKGQLTGIYFEQIERKAQELEGTGNILLFAEHFTPILVQKLAARVMEGTSSGVFAFAGNDQEGYKYAIGQTGGDLRALGKDMNAALGGRGGGKPFFQQGSLAAKRAEIEAFFRERLEGIRVEDI